MTLPEAVAVVLYLRNDDRLAWREYRDIFNEAWGVIWTEAERVINAKSRTETDHP
jgi:hypothetical protein